MPPRRLAFVHLPHLSLSSVSSPSAIPHLYLAYSRNLPSFFPRLSFTSLSPLLRLSLTSPSSSLARHFRTSRLPLLQLSFTPISPHPRLFLTSPSPLARLSLTSPTSLLLRICSNTYHYLKLHYFLFITLACTSLRTSPTLNTYLLASARRQH